MRAATHSSGFSLIEILISVAVIAGALAIFQVAFNNETLVRASADQELAFQAANHKLEDLRALGYSALPASGTFADTLFTKLNGASGSYTTTTFNSGVKQVTVTVSWTETGMASTHTVSVSSLVSSVGGL